MRLALAAILVSFVVLASACKMQEAETTDTVVTATVATDTDTVVTDTVVFTTGGHTTDDTATTAAGTYSTTGTSRADPDPGHTTTRKKKKPK